MQRCLSKFEGRHLLNRQHHNTKRSFRSLTANLLQCAKNNNTREASSSSRCFTSYSFKGEKLRVAVVGGGCAGLSASLHLAPLVEQGLIAGPIDVFDSGKVSNRDIGVGIWSTGLDGFRNSNRKSHELVFNCMTKTHGTWIGDVGYRTPNGAWLMKSHLPLSQQESDQIKMPALIFLRERDMIQSLQKAVHLEEHQGTIQVHRNASSRVDGLYEESSKPWSTNLLLPNQQQKQQQNQQKNTARTTKSERDYHLIIAADGMNSVLRRTYGGHENVTRRLTGTSALPSPIDLPQHSLSNIDYSSWDKSQQQEVVGLQDRHYTVFRGNAQMASSSEEHPQQPRTSFQTWGEGRSMRFATVPMMYQPTKQGGLREERQVWFITIDDDEIAKEPDPVKRRDRLLEAFKDWHDPIRQTVLSTPPEEILVERAIAHRHCMGPVLSFNSTVVRHLRGKRPPSSGEGPCIVFLGDASMTIDPILAQGFTMAMEGAASLRHAIEQSCVAATTNQSTKQQQRQNEKDPCLAFDPLLMRRELKRRQMVRMDRLISLLRSTELVQALGQPSGNTTITGILNTKVLRPLARLTPNFIKAPIFDAVLKYSLGLGLFRKPVVQQQPSASSSSSSPPVAEKKS